MRMALLTLAALTVVGCSGWPFPGDSAEMPADSAMIHRFETASKKLLGSASDVQGIHQTIGRAYPDLKITEIRWISRTQAIVAANDLKPGVLGGDYYYVPVSKGADGWQADQRRLYGTDD
jgi:hypothetical protein